MEYPRPLITIAGREFEILSQDEFRERRGLPNVSNQTIENHLKKESLDFTQIGRFRYIIWNEKAKKFNLNYAKQLNAA